jgi:hypothetical protein
MSTVEPAPECGWALEMILDDRDRLGEPDTAGRLRVHLEVCVDCRRVQRTERRLVRALAAGPLPPTPADLLLRVKSLVRRRRLLRRLALTGFAAALLGAVGALVAVLC